MYTSKDTKRTKNPQLFALSFKIIIKTHTNDSKDTKGTHAAGAGLLPVRASSVEKHLPRTLAQLRTHARTTRTRNETETDFPIGFS